MGSSRVVRWLGPRAALLAVCCALAACGGESAPPAQVPPADCAPPKRVVGDRCLDAGVQDDGCPAGSLGRDDGTCQAAGIHADACATGFVHDGDVGCDPILPADPCPAGSMAVPGDAQCRTIMECGAGKWGGIAVDASTVYVDASYAGADSDGSAARPWTTVQEAIDAAPSGALVAIAAGSYEEPVRISGDPVRLHGVCPSKVEIVATGASAFPCFPAALCVLGGADGSEVRGIAVRGDGRGVAMAGSEGVVLDRVWVHDVTGIGVSLEDAFGPTSAILRGSLVEAATDRGVAAASATVNVEASVVRGTLPGLGGVRGRGVSAEPSCDGARCARATLTMTGSVVENNREAGVVALDADATIAASVIRDTTSQELDEEWGAGVVAQVGCSGGGVCDPAARSHITVSGAVVERNQAAGLFVIGSEATIETTVVRDTVPKPDGSFGAGIVVQIVCDAGVCEPTARATARLVSVVVERNFDSAVRVAGSDVTIEGSVLRHTKPRTADESRGRGIDVGPPCVDGLCDVSTRSSANLRGVVVDGNHEVGIFVSGSDAVIDGTVVRGTAPNASTMRLGDGMTVQIPCITSAECSPTARSIATLRASMFEQNHEVAVSVVGSDAVIEHSVIRGTNAVAGDLFGDGVGVVSPFAADLASPATAKLMGVSVEDNVRAGVASFGAFVSLRNTAVKCAAFEIEGETFAGNAFTFVDEGGNLCGCPAPVGQCIAASPGLPPPAPALVE